MSSQPIPVYYIDCPINTPVYSVDNELLGYTDGYRARPTLTSKGSICLSLNPNMNNINRKNTVWISNTGKFIVGFGIKLCD